MNAPRLSCRIAPPALALSLASFACSGDDSGGGGAGSCEADMTPGDIVISEVMANPIGQSAGKEWIEIYNASSDTIQLEGALLVNGEGTGAATHEMGELEIGAGEYAVLGNVEPDFMEDYHDYAYEDDLGSLPNGGGHISIECDGDLVDSANYPEMSEGVAMGFDGALEPDHTLNTDPDNWCEAEQEFDADGSLGTPGERNDACGAVSQDTCNDNGEQREVIEPEEGDLVISEVMAQTVPEVNYLEGEWFAVYVAAEGGVDLNGLQIGRYFPDSDPDQEPGPREVGHTLGSAACLHHDEGSHVLFARSEDPELNGGLPDVDYIFNLDHPSAGLASDHGGVYVGFGIDDVEVATDDILDYVTWERPWRSGCGAGHNYCGASIVLDPSHLNTEANKDPSNWCHSADRFSEHGRGTPGEQNAACFAGGPCLDPDSGEIRAAQSPEEGDLVITEVLPNTQDGVSGRQGGWFEVLIKDDADLNALQIGRYDPEEDHAEEIQNTLAFRECLFHEGGSHILFALETDQGVFDPIYGTDIEVDYRFNFRGAGGFQLTQSDDGLFLTFDNDREDLAEHMTWESSESGLSLSLDCGEDDTEPECSSDLDNWCEADELKVEDELEPYFCCGGDGEDECPDPDDGSGEGCSFGTPGEENPACEDDEDENG